MIVHTVQKQWRFTNGWYSDIPVSYVKVNSRFMMQQIKLTCANCLHSERLSGTSQILGNKCKQIRSPEKKKTYEIPISVRGKPPKSEEFNIQKNAIFKKHMSSSRGTPCSCEYWIEVLKVFGITMDVGISSKILRFDSAMCHSLNHYGPLPMGN